MARILHTLLMVLCVATAAAQSPYDEVGWLPERGDHLVYDYCGILTAEQTDVLEARLLAFNDTTSNQVVVMVTPGFGGNDISQFAFDVGEKWGIGQKGLGNGVLIVVKPKDATKGEVEIATGTGLEGALPDIFCKRIIENEMIPCFREGDYYGGIVAALDVILPVCAGEYSYRDYKAKSDGAPLATLLLTLGIIVAVLWLIYKADKSGGGWSDGSSGGGTYFGGNTRMSGWGGGSWSGGSSGGFGGFGGGSFGGGGARGSW